METVWVHFWIAIGVLSALILWHEWRKDNNE